MGPSRTRTIGVVTAVVMGALALRPVSPLERALDVALAPGRVLVSIAAPIGALQGVETGAARERRAQRDEADLAAHRRLEARVRAAAWPAPERLAPGVGAVPAEVVGHVDRELDVLRLRVSEPERVEIGQPVVAGDGYVGLVTRIPGREPPPPAPANLLARLARRLGLVHRAEAARADEVLVELVTARDARIGGRIEEDEDGGACRLVVGGLAPSADTYLAVHNPQRRAVSRGVVRVFEPEALTDEASVLAHGFLVGDLSRDLPAAAGGEPSRELLGVRPYLDYESGLHQVLVLTRGGSADPAPPLERTVLGDSAWRSARYFLRAEPSPWREGRQLDRGRRDDVRAGAAVVTGARLVGRVTRAGIFTSSVALLGDPGFTLSVLAVRREDPPSDASDPRDASHASEAREASASPGEPGAPSATRERALVLGRIVSLGRRGDGRIAFAWDPPRPLDAPAGGTSEERLAVDLWTGSGEPGVPRGLLVGAAELPFGAGPHVIHVREPEGTSRPAALRVRASARAEEAP